MKENVLVNSASKKRWSVCYFFPILYSTFSLLVQVFIFCWSFYVFEVSFGACQTLLDCLGNDYHSRNREKVHFFFQKKAKQVFFRGFKLAMFCTIAENCAIMYIRNDVPRFFFLGKMLHILKTWAYIVLHQKSVLADYNITDWLQLHYS